MRSSDLVRVGVAVIVGLVLFIGASFWLRGALSQADTYRFSAKFGNAQGIQKGAYVRVGGVNVGQVEHVGLGPDEKLPAVLTLQISRRMYPQVRPTDSVRIVGGVIGFGQPIVEITPGGRKEAVLPGPDGAVPGDSGGGTDKLMSEADSLLQNLTELSKSMTKLASSLSSITDNPEVRGSLTRTVSNFEKFSGSGVRIARNMEVATARADRIFASFQSTADSLNRSLAKADSLIASFRGTAEESRAVMRDARGVVGQTGELMRSANDVVKNTNEVVKNSGGLVTDARGALAENKEKLKAVFDNLNASLKQLDSTLAEARSFVADPELRTNLKATSENVRDATETLKKVAGDVRGLTGDPKVQEDLRATISGLRDATEQAADVFARVREVLGHTGGTAKTIQQKLSETRLDFGVLHGTSSDRTRIDFNATIPWSDSVFYRIGMWDFGDSNKFSAQRGQRLSGNLFARYGMYASTLGLGLDYRSRGHSVFSADFFGVDDPRVDLEGHIPVTHFLDLTAGVDNVFGHHPDPVFGIRFKR